MRVLFSVDVLVRELWLLRVEVMKPVGLVVVDAEADNDCVLDNDACDVIDGDSEEGISLVIKLRLLESSDVDVVEVEEVEATGAISLHM